MAEHDDHIEREVQRRLARHLKSKNDEIADLHVRLQECMSGLTKQHYTISRLTGDALNFGTLVWMHNHVDPTRFRPDDEVIITDPLSPYHQQGGVVVKGDGNVVVADGTCLVKVHDGTVVRFAVGVEGKAPAQIRLTKKDDGTYCIVNIDGKPWEVRGVPDLGLSVGDQVKVRPDNKAVVGRGISLKSGPVCLVMAVSDAGVEVIHKGDHHLVYNPQGFELQEGDRVACDQGMFSVVQKLPQEDRNRYKVAGDFNVAWDDIGGLTEAKRTLQDAVELPLEQPEIFAHYGIEPLRGVLLYGPSGVGKTLLARATASTLARLHGHAACESAYLYVKSPQLLSKWVGETEREIRLLFELCRRHYRKHGYKAVLVLDEADALMCQRGTRRSSDITDTIVPMFLGEMDGVDPEQTAANPFVMLLTNRADVLDPAITRPGRISRHIKVDRPDEMTSIEILDIHTKKLPFRSVANRMAVLAVAASDLFSKSRLLYRINGEHDFTLGDCVNGAMLASVAEMAKMIALHRDVAEKSRSGLQTEDFRQAVQNLYGQQRGINHSLDLADFAEKHGLQSHSIQVERCFGAA